MGEHITTENLSLHQWVSIYSGIEMNTVFKSNLWWFWPTYSMDKTVRYGIEINKLSVILFCYHLRRRWGQSHLTKASLIRISIAESFGCLPNCTFCILRAGNVSGCASFDLLSVFYSSLFSSLRASMNVWRYWSSFRLRLEKKINISLSAKSDETSKENTI